MKLSRGTVIGSSLLLAFGIGGVTLVACSSDDNATAFPVGAGKDASTSGSHGLGGDDDSGSSIGFDDSGSGNPVINGDDDDDSGRTTSGDDGSTTPPGDDSGSGDDDDGGAITDAGADADAGAVNGDASCRSFPTIPSATSGNYCFGASSPGLDSGCAPSPSTGTPICCDEAYMSGKSTRFADVCIQSSSTCTAGMNATLPDGGDAGPITSATAYECDKSSDCAARFTSTKYCFLVPSATADAGALTPGGCGKITAGSASGTVCGSATGTSHSSGIQLCTTSADCLDGKSCHAIVYSGNDFGGCY